MNRVTMLSRPRPLLLTSRRRYQYKFITDTSFKPSRLFAKLYLKFTSWGTNVVYGRMETTSPVWNRIPDRSVYKSDGADWEHHDPENDSADGLYLLAKLAPPGASLFIMPGEGGHHYVTLTKIPVGPRGIVTPTEAEDLLFKAFYGFPSFAKTILDKTFTKLGAVTILNWGDHVKSFGILVRKTEQYVCYRVPVGTEKGKHSLGGLLDHEVLSYEDEEGTWVVIARKGVGHQKSFDTPGTSLSDLTNILAGGASWIFADKVARAWIYGEGEAEVKRLSRNLSTWALKGQNTVGGVLSRRVLQPISALTYPRTAETALFAYVCAVLGLLVVLYQCMEEEAQKEDRDASELLELE